MTEQRSDRIETPDGNIHTTTIVTDEPRRSGISGWFVMFVVLLAVVVAIWVLMGRNDSEVAKDNAVAEAASRVSTTAEQVGDAAAKVGNAAQDTASAAAQNAANEAQSAADDAEAAASDAAQ